jgi:hypothetical protein
MAQEYRKFELSPGQQSPEGSTGLGLSSGWIVWYGEEKTFPKNVKSELMTQAEIDEYTWTKDFPNRMNEAKTLLENSALKDIAYSKIDTNIGSKELSMAELTALVNDLYKIVLALLKYNGLVK